jgi:hypothetical protein
MAKKNKRHRTFILKDGSTPPSYTLASRTSLRRPLVKIVKDEDGNEQAKSLRYSRVHSSPFLDEQKGEPILDPIVFYDGALVVDTVTEANLITFLEATPDFGQLFEEMNKEKDAEKEMAYFDLELKAMNFVKDADVEVLKNVLRAYEYGEAVLSDMLTKEVKVDAMILAKRDPEEFMLYVDDPDIQRSNMSRLCLDRKLLSLRNKETDWYKTLPGEKASRFLTVPFEEDAYEALEKYFEEDKEGRELFIELTKRLEEL